MADAPADTVTMTRAQAEMYQRGMNLLSKLETDPRSKPLIEEAVKIHHPDVVTERETVERQVTPLLKPVEETLAKINARFDKEDEDRAAAAQRQTEADIDAAFARLSKAGYTEEGLEKIKGIMVDRKIADVEAAALVFDKQNPAPATEANSYTPQTWDLGASHGAGGDTKLLFDNPDTWTDKQIPLILNELRGGQ